jgi:hypothetical protein
MTQSKTPRRHFRTALVVANLAMVAVPTWASAGGGDDLAAGLAIGCCAGMAAASMVHAAEQEHAEQHRPRQDVHVTEVRHVHETAPPALPHELHPAEARAELLEAELWAQRHCLPIIEQPAGVQVYVTFRGEDGRAVQANFQPALRGEDFAGCMKSAYLESRVSRFGAREQTVRKSLGG